jgi:calcium-dependent protein kinase
LYDSFKALDANSDGKLSKKEVLEGYTRIYPHLSQDEITAEVNRIFEAADQDGNGELDYSEWQVATINKNSILQENKL